MTERDKIFEEIVRLFVYAGNMQGKDGYPEDLHPNSRFHISEIHERIRHYQKTGGVLTHHKHWMYLADKAYEEKLKAEHRAIGCNCSMGNLAI